MRSTARWNGQFQKLLSDEIKNGVGPFWSPDGSTLVIESASTIYFVDPDKPDAPIVYEYGDWPTWTSDSQMIVARIGFDIGMVDKNGEFIKSFPIQHSENGALQRPSLSPDGKKIAFIYSDYPNGTDGDVVYNLRVLDIDSGNVDKLTDFPLGTAISNALNWTADSNEIIFSYSNYESKPASMVAKVSLADHKVVDLVEGHTPTLSYDGTKILFAGDWLEVIDTDGNQRAQITDRNIHGSWSSDNQSIVTDYGHEIHIINLNGTVEKSFPVEMCSSIS